MTHMTERQARKLVTKLDDTYTVPEKRDENQQLIDPGFGLRKAKLGKHVTNGETRWVVHITHPDNTFAPYTLTSENSHG